MRILFYLPVITPWWFDHIVAPMLYRLNEDNGVAEVHVMVAPLWRNTGVNGEQLLPIVDLAKLRWHIIDEEDPELFRIAAHRIPGLLETVASIAPDLTLARSADFVTPAHFGGTLRYIMEGAAAPFATDPAWFVLEERPFAYGGMVADIALLDACVACTEGLWERTRAAVVPRAQIREQLGLPQDLPVLAVPLQYEHDENFYLLHAAFPDSIALLTNLLEKLPEKSLLAVSDHPLNRQYVSRSPLASFAASKASRLRLIEAEDATAQLTLAADAVVTDLSKTWSLAAFAGTPLLHVGRIGVADWLGANSDIAAFGNGTFTRPDPAAARRWFAWHLAARLLRPAAVDLGLLLRHVAGAPTLADFAANMSALTALAGVDA